MPEILINYEEVYKKTAELRNYISSDLKSRITNEYAGIQGALDQLDSGTNASLKGSMERNRDKAFVASGALEKLLSFMERSCKEFEAREREMAATIEAGGGSTVGGED